MADRLKLRAADAEDLAVISACLQDAIVRRRDMRYLRAERCFLLAASRFRWETRSERAGNDDPFERVSSAMTVEGVTAVRFRGLDQAERDGFLDLLALEAGEGRIDLIFAGGGAIRLEVEGIRCRLEDFDEPWPTWWRPEHGDDATTEGTRHAVPDPVAGNGPGDKGTAR